MTENDASLKSTVDLKVKEEISNENSKTKIDSKTLKKKRHIITRDKDGKVKITFTKERETALVTLYARAIESERSNTFFYDKGALDGIKKIDYQWNKNFSRSLMEFGSFKVSLRSRTIDDFILKYLQDFPNCFIVQMGCGLDDRFHRIDNGKITFIDLDFPDSIEIHKALYHDKDKNKRHHYIGSDVTKIEWMRHIKRIKSYDKKMPILFIGEGLFMYISKVHVKNILAHIHKEFPSSLLIMDVFNDRGKIKSNKSLLGKQNKKSNTIGALFQWSINDDMQLEQWNKEYKVIYRKSFYWDHNYWKKMNRKTKWLLYCLCCPCGSWKLFKVMSNTHRIIALRLGNNTSQK